MTPIAQPMNGVPRTLRRRTGSGFPAHTRAAASAFLTQSPTSASPHADVSARSVSGCNRRGYHGMPVLVITVRNMKHVINPGDKYEGSLSSLKCARRPRTGNATGPRCAGAIAGKRPPARHLPLSQATRGRADARAETEIRAEALPGLEGSVKG